MGGMIDINITLLIQLANFLVLMVIMDRLFYRPLLKAMDGRKEKVEGLLRETEELRSKLANEKEDYEQRWDRELTLAVPVRLGQRAEAYEIYRSRLAEARDKANQVLAEELKGMDGLQEQAWTKLSGQIDEMAKDMSEKLLALDDGKGGSK